MRAYSKKLCIVILLLAGVTTFAQTPPLPPAPVTSGGSGANMAVINDNLRVINNAFSKYNSYETIFTVEGDILRWKSTVADITGNISDLIFYVNYTNNWIVVKCLEGECLTGTSFNEEYSMSLKTESGDISPDMSKVLNALNNIRAEVLGK
jgi:mRNA-degrading endonuclease HigB of HigAB toxin-antitoxin module